jgi:hypothetical protein
MDEPWRNGSRVGRTSGIDIAEPGLRYGYMNGLERALAGVLLTSLLLGGCGAFAGGAATQATRGAVGELGRPETRDQIASILADPEINAATHELTASVTGAFLDELTTQQRRARIGEALSLFAGRVGSALGEEFAGALVVALPELTDSLLEAAASETGRQQLSAVGGALTEGVGTAFATSLREDLGPAARDAIALGVADGMSEALADERLQVAIGETARTIGRETVLGVEEGLREAREHEDAVLGTFGQTAERGAGLFRMISIALGVGTALFVGLFVWALLRQRRAQKESQASEASLLLLASVIEVAQDQPWGRELIRLLQDEVGEKPGADHLRELLDRHPELRVHVPRRGEPRAPGEGPVGGGPMPRPT